MKLDDIKSMDTRIEDGAWVDSIQLTGVKFRVRGEGCLAHQAVLTKLWGAVSAEDREKPEVEDEITRQGIRDALLLDWRGIDDEYNTDTADDALKIPMFRRAVVLASRMVAERGRSTVEADAKN